MEKCMTKKAFRDREGKDLEKLSPKQVAALKVYKAKAPYQSKDKEWVDYLVAEGFVERVEEQPHEQSSASSTQSTPKKRAPRKKASE